MAEKTQNEMAIVFDLGGVLIDWNPRYLYRKMFDGDEEKIDHFLNVVCPMEWNETMDAGRPFAEAVKERSQKYPEYERYIRAYHERWIEMVGSQNDQTVAVLAQIKEQAHPLYALSNWSAETFPLVKDRFHFLDWFDAVVISGEVKAAKPERVIYEHLLQKTGLPAQQCLFIDDNERNILAAERLGFQTIHFSDANNLRLDLIKRDLLNGG